MVRMTTGGVMRSYRTNLMGSFIANNKARDTVLSQRNFNSYAEDPAAAARAFRLRMSRLRVNSQYAVCEDTWHKQESAFSSLQTIDELIDTKNGGGTALATLKSTTLEMLNDPKGDARTQLTTVLDQLSDSIIQNMNQKYGDDFIFAGADGHNVPFEVKTENGQNKLYYRGVPVDAHIPNIWKDGDSPILVNSNGEYDPAGTLYLNTDNITKMSVADYEAKYTAPQVHRVQAENSDGTPKYEADGTTPIMVNKPYNAYGDDFDPAVNDKVYFAKTPPYDPTDTTKKPAPSDLIAEDDYYKALARQNNPAKLLQNSDTTGTDSPVYVDENGVPVADKPGDVGFDPENIYVMIVKSDPKTMTMDQDQYDAAVEDAEKLEYLMKETRYVDIGLGFQENENGELIPSSGYNEALNGLTFLGHGLDEDGDPMNIYSICQRLKEIASNVSDGGTWSEDVYEEFRGLVLKLEDASSEFKTQFTDMAAGTQKLENNLDLLKDNFYNLDTQTSNLEDVDMADAITSFLWAEYCYNAALKVGNSILSQSLMDYIS